MQNRLFRSSDTDAEESSPMLGLETRLGKMLAEIPYVKMPGREQLFKYFKLNDLPQMVEVGARLMANYIRSLDLANPCFVTPEASTMALAHVLRVKYNIPGVVVYKNKQLNDVDPVCVEYDVVTAADKKSLYLGHQKLSELIDKDIVIIDSICTRGGTIRATYDLLCRAGISPKTINAGIVLFTEEEPRQSLVMNDGSILKLKSFQHIDVKELQPINSINK